MVHAIDAHRRLVAFGLPIRAKIKVHAYMPNSPIAAISAKMRFKFFMRIILSGVWYAMCTCGTLVLFSILWFRTQNVNQQRMYYYV